MRFEARTGLLLAIAASVAAVACSSSGGGGGPSVAGNTAVSGFAVDFATGNPVSAATVAAMNGPSVLTAADGSWTLMLASNATVFATASKSNYINAEIGAIVPPGGATGVTFAMISQAAAGAVAAVLGFTVDTTKGGLAVYFGTVGTGYGATLSAAVATSSFTFVNGTNPVYSRTTLQSNQVLVFVNVAPGTTTITPTHPAGRTCTPVVPGITNWRVDPNTISAVAFNCL